MKQFLVPDERTTRMRAELAGLLDRIDAIEDAMYVTIPADADGNTLGTEYRQSITDGVAHYVLTVARERAGRAAHNLATRICEIEEVEAQKANAVETQQENCPHEWRDDHGAQGRVCEICNKFVPAEEL